MALPAELRENIKRPVVGDRSKAIFKVIAELIRLGLDDPAIENIICAHPNGIGEKYAGRNDVDKEITRVRRKTAFRPIVQLRGGQLPWIIDQAEQHLLASQQDVYQRGSLIVRPVQEDISIADGRKVSTTRLAQIRSNNMRETFSRAIDFQNLVPRTGWISVDCPKQIADTYLEREGNWHLPRLARIITAPTLRADGSILDQPGYDEATGLLFEPQGVDFLPVPTTPRMDDLLDAARTIEELLKTFPFVDKPSRAVAVSAILTSRDGRRCRAFRCTR